MQRELVRLLSAERRAAVRLANDEMVARYGGPDRVAATVTEEMLACVDSLTERQLDSLVLAAKGLSDSEIANHLGIARMSVSDHLKAVYKRLGVSSRVEAAVILAKCGGL